MDISKNHETIDYFAADDSPLTVDTPQVVITGAEANDESPTGVTDESQLDTSIVGISELRTEAESSIPYDGQPPLAVKVTVERPSEVTTLPVAVREDPPSLAQAAGTIAFSVGESTGDVETPVDYTEVTDHLGGEPTGEEPDNEPEAQEDDSQAEPLAGGGDGIDPPSDDLAAGTAEGDDNPDRASELISVRTTQAIWDMGKVLIDAQGESGPFPVGELDDGTIMYDNDFPGMRIYEFPGDIVAEAGYPAGTEVRMSDTPPQYLDMSTEKYEQHDPRIHSEPPDTQHLLQVTIDSEVEGVFYSGNFDIIMDPNGGLEANYLQRSGIIRDDVGDQTAPDKPFEEYTQEEMDTFIEGATELAQSIQDEGDFHGFSEADGARVLRLIGLAIMRTELN